MTEQHQVVLLPSGRRGSVPHGTTLLNAAQMLGVEIESICGGRQVCGKCLVSPEYGRFAKHGIDASPDHVSTPDATETTYAEQHALRLDEVRLSCAACVLGDVVVNVPEHSLARKQAIRKEAGTLTIEVSPVCQLVYVDVSPAQLGAPADWQRVQQALAAQHDLHNLTIDPLLLRELQTKLRDGDWSLTLTVWDGREVIRVEPGYTEYLYGMAVDVGSTTIVGHLCDLRTGEVLATASQMNPQVRYGEDLMSRVSFGMMNENGVERMHRAVIKALNDLITDAAEQAGIAAAQVSDVVLVGNTVMHHLLLGVDPVELGGAPFALATQDALDIKARDLGLGVVGRAAMVHLLPCIAGHVGADNVAVLLAEQPHFDEQVSLIVDVGTNAEILLGTRERVLSASSPTGPAFEGAQIEHGQRAATGAIERVRVQQATGQPSYKVIGDERWSHDLAEGESLSATGICGSGIIEVIAELYLAGLVDASGQFVAAAVENNPHVRARGKTAEYVLVPGTHTANGQDIVVTQQDIRAIQLAKGALYAGIKLLMAHMGVQRVDRVKLAGAFGSYIDPKYAMILGLIPDCDLSAVSTAGNAAGDGARIALLNTEQREAIQAAARHVHYVETAVEADFQDYFVAAMGIPNTVDPYPHLADILPTPVVPENTGARRGRRRARRQST